MSEFYSESSLSLYPDTAPIYPISLNPLYEQNKKDNDRIRQEIQEWMFDYYSGEYSAMIMRLEAVMRIVLGADVVKTREWVYEFRNITKKMIDRMAVVYKEPAIREIEDEMDAEEQPTTEYLDYILPVDINSKDKRAHRYAKLFNTSLTQVYFNKETGKVDFRIEPPYLFKVEVDENNPYKAIKVSYDKYFTNTSGDDELYTVVWTAEEHYKEDQNGKKTKVGDNEDMVNPWRDEDGNGVLPFVELRLEEGEDFWGGGQCDIVNLNETMNFLLTFQVNDAVILGSTGTLLAVNLGLDKKVDQPEEAKKVRVGRRHPIVVDNVRPDMTTPSLQYVSTQPLIAEIQNTIDYRIKQLAVIKGLNPNTIISEIKDTSDAQKQMDSWEMLEVRRDDIDACRNYEMKRWEVIKAVNNTAYKDAELKSNFGLEQIPWDAELKVDFADIKIELTPEQLWADRKEREARNMNTPVDWLMEENTELTEEEAEEILQKNREKNSTNNRPVSRLESLLNRPAQSATEPLTNEGQVNE